MADNYCNLSADNFIAAAELSSSGQFLKLLMVPLLLNPFAMFFFSVFHESGHLPD